MYHTATEHLEAKLADLRAERVELEAAIERTERTLAPPSRRWSRDFARLALCAVSLCSVCVLALALVVPRVGGGPEGPTRRRASALRSAAELYRSVEPTMPCPTRDVLRAQGFIGADFEAEDGWDHPFTLRCDGGRVVARSYCFDGEDVRARAGCLR